MSRPLPWHDVPKCREPACGGPIVDFSESGGGYRCGACGAGFSPSPEERAQLERAEAAWALVLAGEAHEDRACARCGGVLPIGQQRLCPPCVKADASERNLSLFPDLTPTPHP